MAGSVNKVILVGNLGRDPETRTFPSGGKVVNLRIATSEKWRDRNSGESRERTEWHSVAIYNENLGRIAEQYLRKGSKVYLEGQLETRKWQDLFGQDRYTTEIALRPYRGELTLLDGRDGGLGEFGGIHIPLLGQPRLDDHVRAVAMGHLMDMGLDLLKQAPLLEHGDDLLARLEAVEAMQRHRFGGRVGVLQKIRIAFKLHFTVHLQDIDLL